MARRRAQRPHPADRPRPPSSLVGLASPRKPFAVERDLDLDLVEIYGGSLAVPPRGPQADAPTGSIEKRDRSSSDGRRARSPEAKGPDW
jgi:hypothetical protein